MLGILGLGLYDWSHRERTPDLEPIQGGKWYLFSCGHVMDSTELYRQNLETGQIDRLTINSWLGDIQASWSPDGERIVYVRYGLPSNQVYTMRTDGEDRQRLVYLDGDTYYPAWSPDGQWIAFAYRPRSGTFQEGIYRASPDGSQVEALITWNRVYNPIWSPDGQKLAFTSLEERNEHIYVMDLAQHTFEYISPGGDAFWSLDSSKLFVYYAYSPDDTYIKAHRIVDLNTKEQFFITPSNPVWAEFYWLKPLGQDVWGDLSLHERWRFHQGSYWQRCQGN
jgi:Tol biopolymer transport system component